MSTVTWPHTEPFDTTCYICKQIIPSGRVTVGASYSDGSPAFACETHRSDSDAWVVGWSTVIADPPPHNSEDRLFLETREVHDIGFKADLVRHLCTRAYAGRAVIVAERPAVALSVLRKKWKLMVQLLQLRRASTLDLKKRAAYEQLLLHVHSLRFSSYAQSDAHIIVVSAAESYEAQDVRTFYILPSVAEAGVCNRPISSFNPRAAIIHYRAVKNFTTPWPF